MVEACCAMTESVERELASMNQRVTELEDEMSHLGDQCAQTLDVVETLIARIRASLRDN